MGAASSINAIAKLIQDDQQITQQNVIDIIGIQKFNEREYERLAAQKGYITGKQFKSHLAEKVVLPPIRVIKLDDFNEVGSFPRYPDNKNIVVDLDTIDRDNCFIVFISHCWLRGWNGAEGWDGRPHPDNATHEKYKLCVAGIKKCFGLFAKGMKDCYVWLDFGCMDQDGNPAGELKQLDEIVRFSDCMFTPVFGPATLPSSITSYYDDYKSDKWNNGPSGYVNRCWCRVEMFYAANIPTVRSVDGGARLDRLNAGLRNHASNGVRPHIIYGTRELEEGQTPLLLPPLQNSYFEKFHPAKGHLSVEGDRLIIDRLIAELKPYMKFVKTGFVPNPALEGCGTYTYASGNKYVGSWVDNKRHGDGKLYHASGNMYEGTWDHDKMHGKGKFSYADGSYYEGDWAEGDKHGKGEFHDEEGGLYVGDWNHDKMHGKGKFRYASGDYYEGDWVEDVRHGKGEFHYADGKVYVGDYNHHKMHGKGKFTFQSGGYYDGDWVSDKMTGMGHKRYSNGSEKTGEFKDGKYIQ